ncbi:hypothetical protein [Treponema endosymbiont of Eucomonympha sp.]|uniref:hypothetical protein n=1 Tax=Treponema endosymbiont of Eucomonympha sp. TaxID=1580831 RepID=UPI001396799B|nr:hypothetical protein [Treponema endosymbiont of Eucomonympha sp.]
MRRFWASAAGAALFLGCISSASDTQPQPQDLYFRVKGTDCYARAYGEYKGKESYDYVFFGSAELAEEAYLAGKSALAKALDETFGSKEDIVDKSDPQPYSAACVLVLPKYETTENDSLPWVSALDKDTLILFMKTKPPVLAYRREAFKYVGSERPESTPDHEVWVFD